MFVTMMEYRHPVARSKAVRFLACRRDGLLTNRDRALKLLLARTLGGKKLWAPLPQCPYSNIPLISTRKAVLDLGQPWRYLCFSPPQQSIRQTAGGFA
jgi:hypothetical protein